MGIKSFIGMFSSKEDEKGMSEEFAKWQASHRKWRERLALYVAGSSGEKLSAEECYRDDRCELGLWLKTEGMQAFGNTQELKELAERHAQFHKTVGKVVGCCHAGEKAEAQKLLEVEVERDTTRMTVALAKMERKVNGL